MQSIYCGDLVDFKFGIDFPEYVTLHQLIDHNIENFHVRALNGRRLSFENSLESLKSVHLEGPR